MPEQLIATRFPGQLFPVRSVVAFFDRHRGTVFGTVTELRLHEAIVAGGETVGVDSRGDARAAPRGRGWRTAAVRR